MIFREWHPEKIWHQHLIHLPTLPVYCNHFTLGNPKKSFFNSIIHTDLRLLRYRRINKLQLLYCSLSVYLLLFAASIICLAPFYGQFFNLFGQSFSKPPMPTHNRLFSVTNIWRNATLPAVRCKSFTFYKVVWWHFSCVVSKGVTVCFFLR